MPRLRAIVMAAAVATLAIGAIGAPAGAAAKAHLAIVQGIPGKVVDVCIDGKEIKSGVRYGAKAFKSIAPGSHALKVRARQLGTCTGTTLAAKSLSLDPGDDLTIVATAHAPMKVVVFDNAGLGIVPATTTIAFAIRDAADIVGGVNIKLTEETPSPITPAADAIWQKGDSDHGAGPASLPDVITVQATLPDDIEPVAGPVALALRDGHRHEWILIGTNANNARIVTIVRLVSFF